MNPNNPFSDIQNPFPAGPPVLEDAFYGYDHVINKVMKQVEHGNCLLLGMRRVGKTSILRKIAKDYENCIFFDLARAQGTWRGFQKYLTRAILRQSNAIPWLPSASKLNKADDICDALDILNEYAHQHSQTLTILCDEAELLIHLAEANHHILNALRSCLWDADSKLRFVFASSKQLVGLDQFTDQGSPFLDPFPPAVYITNFDEQDAQDLIQQKQSCGPLPIKPDVIEKIQHLTNNRPYLIQVVCSYLWDKYKHPSNWQLSPPVIEDIMAISDLRIISTDFEYLSAKEKQVLSKILDDNCNRFSLEEHTLANGLASLGYLSLTNGQLHIHNTFFQTWLNDHKEFWQAPSNVSDQDTQRLYEKELRKSLRRIFKAYYGMQDFRTLVFDLDIEWDNLGGDTFNGKIESLLVLLQRIGRLPELLDLAKQDRPSIDWPKLNTDLISV